MHGGYKGLYLRPKMYAINCANEMWRLCRSNHKHFTWTQIYQDSTKCDLDNKMAIAPRYGHKGWNYQSQIFFRGIGYDLENYVDSCGELLYAECLFDHDLNENKLYSTNQLKMQPCIYDKHDEHCRMEGFCMCCAMQDHVVKSLKNCSESIRVMPIVKRLESINASQVWLTRRCTRISAGCTGCHAKIKFVWQR